MEFSGIFWWTFRIFWFLHQWAFSSTLRVTSRTARLLSKTMLSISFDSLFDHKRNIVQNYRFWQDHNITWNSPTPDFTVCFEKTILVWLPCLFLWLLTPLEITYLCHKPRNSFRTPLSLYNISKLVSIDYNYYDLNKVLEVIFGIFCIEFMMMSLS